MQFKELIEYLDGVYPRSLSMPGDADGVDVCTDYSTEIGGVLLTLDVTLDAIEYAKARAYNCIISHHAMIYSPLNKLDANSGAAARKAAALAKADICAAAFHTRLDAVGGGVNDCLLGAVGISSSEPLVADGVPIGRICDFVQEISVAEFAERADKSLKQFFSSNFGFELKGRVNFTGGGNKIRRLAVVAGSGMGSLPEAVNAGADTFFTGEAKFYDMLGARENYDMSVITAGHVETEATVLPELRRAVLARFPGTRVDYYISGYDGLI